MGAERIAGYSKSFSRNYYWGRSINIGNQPPLPVRKNSNSYSGLAPMASYKMKGIFKGLKVISQIFAVKEHEMEIGNPTDVKHVAHIGWNSSAPPTGNASPSWMNGIRGSSDYSSLGNFAAPSTGTSWASQDFDQPQDRSSLGIVSKIAAGQDAAAVAPCPDVPRPPGKTRRRGKKATAAASTKPTSTPEDRSLTPASPAGAAGASGTQ